MDKPKMYEKRDKAFNNWVAEEYPLATPEDHEVLRQAFNAGWLARKVTVDYAINTMNGEKS